MKSRVIQDDPDDDPRRGQGVAQGPRPMSGDERAGRSRLMSHTLPRVDRGHAIGFLLGFAAIYVVLAGLAEIDATGRYGPLILAAVLVTALVVERVLGGTRPGEAVRRLGFGRPTVRAVVAALVVAALVQMVYPIAAAVTGTSVTLRPGWPWLLVGIFAFHGLAEELVWRGFAFRRLRAGRSFGRAVLLTMPLIAATHIPVVVTSGPAVGVAAMLVAAVTTLPLAHLYEAGRATIWAPAVLHTAIDSFKLVTIPDDATMTFSLLLAAISLTVPLLVLVIPRSPRDLGLSS